MLTHLCIEIRANLYQAHFGFVDQGIEPTNPVITSCLLPRWLNTLFELRCVERSRVRGELSPEVPVDPRSLLAPMGQDIIQLITKYPYVYSGSLNGIPVSQRREPERSDTIDPLEYSPDLLSMRLTLRDDELSAGRE